MSESIELYQEVGRYKLIRLLAEKLSNIEQLGKVAFQKSVYILQTVYGLKSGYKFDFYTYGTYSSDLSFDLKTASSLSFIKIEAHPCAGVTINPNPNIDHAQFLEKCPLPEGSEEAIRNFLHDYSSVSLCQLELDSTIIYLDRILARKNERLSLEAFTEMVLEAKPKFDLGEATRSVAAMRRRHVSLDSVV